MNSIRTWTLVFFLAAMGVAGVGFAFKIYEFGKDMLDESGLGFAGAHLLVYGVVATGFFALLGVCFLRGHFRDIEQAKYDLLEQERRHDRELERPV